MQRRVEIHHAYIDVAFVVVDESGAIVETRGKRLIVKLPDEALLEREAFDRAYDQIQILRAELAEPPRPPVPPAKPRRKNALHRFLSRLVPTLDHPRQVR